MQAVLDGDLLAMLVWTRRRLQNSSIQAATQVWTWSRVVQARR